MNNYKAILGAFLVGVTIFSLLNYAFTLKEKYKLLDDLIQSRTQLGLLENEKQNLLQDLEKEKLLQEELLQDKLKLKQYLQAGRERLRRSFGQLQLTQKELGELELALSLLKDENTVLKEELTEANRQKDNFQWRLSSIDELKKAIAELRKKRHRSLLEILGIKSGPKEKEVSRGNRGFLVKDGEPTSCEKVKIEVSPVPE